MRLLWVFVLAGFLAVSCFAQGVRSTLVGRVTDESGAVIPKTKITVTNINTNEARSAETNDSGEFVVPQLAPGDYGLTAEHEGFSKEARNGIVLETGQQVRLDLTLRLGSISEQVEVSAVAPLLSSENASVGNVVDQKKVVELPLNGRDYLQLAQLQPNVFAPASGSNLGFRGGFNVAGNSEISNQYLLDGVDNNDETTNQPLHRPVLDAVREFRVLTGTYSAEYGRQAGGQVIVTTRGGTNGLHGAAWEFHRNAPLDARSFFAPFKPAFHRNQYGLVLGGPIRRDKTFFFVSWENQNRGQQEAKLASVPLDAFKRGDFSSVSTVLKNPFDSNHLFTGNQIPQTFWSKQGLGLLALFPSPTQPGSSNNIAAAAPGHFNLDQFSARIDHRFSPRDDLYAVYEFADSTEFYPLSNPLCSARDVPGWGCDELQRTQHAVMVWTHIFSPRVINEARLGYTRFGFFRLQQDRDVNIVNSLGIGGLSDAGKTPFNNGAPQISLSNFVTIGGPTNLPQGRHDNTYNYVENLTFILGNHTMKTGFDIRRFLFNSFFTSFGRGAFSFDGTFTGDPVADLLLGLPKQADRNLGEPFHNAMTFASGMYWQDDWKISPRLTLNLGVRYDLDLPLVERVDKVASFDPRTNTLRVAGGREAYIDPATGLLLIRSRSDVGRRLWETDKDNFAPRLGLAWRPVGDSRTVVRAGFGTFYNHQIVGNGLTPLSRNSPFRVRQTSGPFQATDRPSLANAFSGIPSVVAPGIQEDFRTAYTNQWSFGVQRELMQNFVVDVSYLGSQSHKLPIGWNINQAFPGPGSVASRRPYKGFGSITGGFISSIGNANFNALQVRAERRFSRGFSFVSSYTWSKAIDDSDGISAASDVGANAQDARNLRAERGLSAYDVTHRWVLSYVWDLPFHARSKSANAIISGWQLTGILTMQGGRPFSVLAGRDDSNTNGVADRPNAIGDWHLPNPGPDRWFNTCTLLANGTRKFCLPGDNVVWQQVANGFGNEGRNVLRGPTLKNFDLGLHRDFHVTERFLVQFRAEAFNLANHPNFNLPEFRISQNAYGTISGTAFPFQTGAQRQIQFAAKLVF
jgi:hypothetical protein